MKRQTKLFSCTKCFCDVIRGLRPHNVRGSTDFLRSPVRSPVRSFPSTCRSHGITRDESGNARNSKQSCFHAASVLCFRCDSRAPSPYVEGALVPCEVLFGRLCGRFRAPVGATASHTTSQATHETANRVAFMHQVFLCYDSSAPSPYVEGAPASCEVLCGCLCGRFRAPVGATASPARSQATHETANKAVSCTKCFCDVIRGLRLHT